MEDVNALLVSGASMKEIVSTHLSTYIRYSSGIEKALVHLRMPKAMERYVHILHGATGTGKTRSVYERHGEDVFSFGDVGDWFDGYNQEEVILIDEVNYDPVKNLLMGCTLRWWNKFLDRHAMRLNVKHGSTTHSAKAIYLTTNEDPKRDWWTCVTAQKAAAFWRRVNTIKEF